MSNRSKIERFFSQNAEIAAKVVDTTEIKGIVDSTNFFAAIFVFTLSSDDGEKLEFQINTATAEVTVQDHNELAIFIPQLFSVFFYVND